MAIKKADADYVLYMSPIGAACKCHTYLFVYQVLRHYIAHDNEFCFPIFGEN